MRFKVEDGVVTVVLSRRNVLTGLQKLDMPGSARTITKVHDEDSTQTLVLKFEDDEEHYNHPDRHADVRAKPGSMHPITEAFLEAADPKN